METCDMLPKMAIFNLSINVRVVIKHTSNIYVRRNTKIMNRHGKKTPRKRHLVKKKISEKVRTASVLIGKLNTCHYGEDAIIPTFTINYGNTYVIRGRRDSGCQPNLHPEMCKTIRIEKYFWKFSFKWI